MPLWETVRSAWFPVKLHRLQHTLGTHPVSVLHDKVLPHITYSHMPYTHTHTHTTSKHSAVHTNTHSWTHICPQAGLHTHTHTLHFLGVGLCVCMCLCMCMCVCACVCLFLYSVCVCVCVCVCVALKTLRPSTACELPDNSDKHTAETQAET